MKKILFCSAMLLSGGSAFAANGLQPGAVALSVDAFYSPDLVERLAVGTDNSVGMIKGKYMLSRDLQLNGGAGFGVWGGDASGTDFSVAIGVRKFLRVDDLAPFMGARISHTTANDGNVTGFELAAEFGAEYFFSRQFSVEGSASIGYASIKVDPNDYNRFGTSRAGVGFNFYF